MNTKIKNKFLSVVFAILFLGLAVFSWLKPATEFSDSERRPLAKFPTVSASSVFSGKFMKDFETYSTEQFPLRDLFRTIKALTNKYVLLQSDNNKVFEKNGHLSKLEYPLDEESVLDAVKKFQAINEQYFVGTDVNVYYSIIPDKNYFLVEDDYLAMDYERLFSLMTEEADFMSYIDITDLLALESFYKTDTHWKQEEIIPVAQRLGEAMGVELQGEYKKTILDNDFYGVYHGQYALPVAPDKITYLENDILRALKVYDYQNDKEMSVYDMEKAYGKDPYEMFLSGSLSLLTIENENATTDKELVIFRDSFGSSLSPLLAEGYKKITVVDIRYIHPDMLRNFIEFTNQDVLFIYSTMVLNNSETIK